MKYIIIYNLFLYYVILNIVYVLWLYYFQCKCLTVDLSFLFFEEKKGRNKCK